MVSALGRLSIQTESTYWNILELMSENVMFWKSSSRVFDNREECLGRLIDLSSQYSVNGLDSEPAIDGKMLISSVSINVVDRILVSCVIEFTTFPLGPSPW